MAICRRSMATCAGIELTGMNTPAGPKTILAGIADQRMWSVDDDPNERRKSFGRSFYVMSVAYDNYEDPLDNTRNKSIANRINRWKQYVDKHDLGTVVIAPDTPNPVHGGFTVVRSAIYTPNLDNLWRHIIETKPVPFHNGGKWRDLW